VSKQIKSGGLTFMKSLAWSIISTILTVAVYFGSLLLTRENSESVPVFVYTSFFGLLYVYTVANFIVVFMVLFTNINFIRFPEIQTNRWNLLTSMGIPISGLVGSKIVASILALLRQYLMGYLMVIACGFLLKIPYSVNYLITLFLIGAISIFLTVMIALAAAVFFKGNSASRTCLFFAFVFVQSLLVFFEFYHREMYRVDVLVNMFTLSFPSFITFSGLIYILAYALILFVARRRSLHQELMPLGLFDIKPLVCGSETELFLSDGMRNTTILDTGILREEEHARAAVVEKPDMTVVEETTTGFPYVLFISFSLVILFSLSLLLLVSTLLTRFMPFVAKLLGEGMAGGLTTASGLMLLSCLFAVFLCLVIVLLVLKNRNRRGYAADR